MRRIFSILLVISMLFASVLAFSSCGSEPAPPIEDVKDDFVALIEASAEINEIFFGAGLPVISRDEEKNAELYANLAVMYDRYEYISTESKYLTVDEMKKAAELVYTSEYLSSVYMMAFDGYADEIAGVTVARYYESDGWLFQSISYEPLIEGTRTFDFETMKIVKPSRGDYVNVEIESELGGEKLNLTLAFSKTADGWRLDTPTY